MRTVTDCQNRLRGWSCAGPPPSRRRAGSSRSSGTRGSREPIPDAASARRLSYGLELRLRYARRRRTAIAVPGRPRAAANRASVPGSVTEAMVRVPQNGCCWHYDPPSPGKPLSKYVLNVFPAQNQYRAVKAGTFPLQLLAATATRASKASIQRIAKHPAGPRARTVDEWRRPYRPASATAVLAAATVGGAAAVTALTRYAIDTRDKL